ncbi:MAG: amino acid permease [Chloroflexi bacterium]|nr:MAG: amino acid permease [Chloroflexota bacterium]TMG42413.1 MAG: amino acid permease [Chloroflexota bacterium]
METAHEADVRDLEKFGYKQELRRALGVYSSFAVAFSYISPSTGIFTLFILGIALAGPFFWWSWPIVVIGQLIIALNFAEVSSHFPVAGSVYQWTKYLSNRTYSWFTGWIYLFAGVLTVAAVVATVPLVLIPLLNNMGMNIGTDPDTNRNVAALVLLSTTLLSIFGVRLVAIVNNTGVVFEILGMVVFALVLVLFYHHQSVAVFADTSYLGTSNQTGTFLAAMFMSLFVIYGFDTASTLAEETKNPRREAPRAVIAAVIGAAIIGAIFLFAVVIAIPGDMSKFVADTGAGKYPFPLVTIIEGNFPGWAANLYLFVVFAAIYVCCLAIQTSTIRLAFGMARDGKLPFGRQFNKVHPVLHTPIGTCIVIGVLAGLPLIYYAGAATIAIGATGMIYLSYILGNIAILLARLRGWPREDSPFKLGQWGLVVNILGLVWGLAMEINFLWPRNAAVGGQNPPLSALPNLSISGPISNIPVFEFTLGVILLVGLIYWAIAQRRAPDTSVAPAEAPA